ncbi:MAG: helix-turn-helix domain-containing protein [Acetatifactor sp.]|nr:helix-turn-helix domain-containing protein [Acetatifactor sp.]
MRDYSFGNFLHELRVRRGLSQFQLGMLVGVSNKAVSKWENGSAKPQSCILCKLGEVLGVTVDELLACKYRSTENKNIKGVFAMKKALWNKASETLTSLYGSPLL